MIALFPVPTWTAKLMNSVQKKKMAAVSSSCSLGGESVIYLFSRPRTFQTDARVKTVKETLGVLRMVKQFGWEARVKEQIDKAREEELKWIFWRKLLNLVNIVSNFTGQ
jgi:hypothetical protein